MTRPQQCPARPRSAPVAAVTATQGTRVDTATAGSRRPFKPPVPPLTDHAVGYCSVVVGSPVMTVVSDERPSGAHRVRPCQAAHLAHAGAAAFARRGDQQRGLAANMFLAFLVGAAAITPARP